MKWFAQVLSRDEQEQVHATSLRILSEVGVKYLGEKALPILKKNGARVDEQNRVALLPVEMVKEVFPMYELTVDGLTEGIRKLMR